MQQEAEIGIELGEAQLVIVLGAELCRLVVIGQRALEVARLHLRAGERHQRIDLRFGIAVLREDAAGAAEPLGGFGKAPAPQMEDAREHVDQRGNILAPGLPLAAARLFNQGLDARNVAEPELDESERQQIFRIVGRRARKPVETDVATLPCPSAE